MALKSEIYINTERYGKILADTMAQVVALSIASKARRNVRVDTGQLRASINTDRIGQGHYMTFAQTVYAAAQEFGLAPFGKANYSYTPYMRPAAMEASTNYELNTALQIAKAAALRGSSV